MDNNIIELARKLGINLKTISLEQIKKGAQEEWEEHSKGKFRVLNSQQDAIKTALAHLTKNPHYYSKEN